MLEHKRAGDKIGCALGGGGARGLAHIGVLKVLEENSIYPDIITGTSMGAIIGALYASGLRARDIEHLVTGMDWKHLKRLADPTLSLTGLIEGKRITSLLESVLGDRTFENLKREFACVAADIKNGEEVVLRSGSLALAVRASISLPGIMVPVKMGRRYLVDGGLVNQVPVGVCRELGAEYVIAVNVIPDPAKMLLGQDVEATAEDAPENPSNNDLADELILSPTDLYNVGLTAHRDDIEKAVKKFFHEPHRAESSNTFDHPVNKPGKPVKAKAPSLIDVLVQVFTITGYRLALENMQNADLKISPAVEPFGFWQFDRVGELIQAGEKAARSALANDKQIFFYAAEPHIEVD